MHEYRKRGIVLNRNVLIRVGCTIFTFVLGLGSLCAQEEEEKKLGWFDAAELTYVSTAGNSEARTLGFRNTLRRVWEDANFTFDVSLFRASSGTVTRTATGSSPDDFQVIKESVSELTAENYNARGQYDRNLSARLYWFAGAGWDRNPFAGIRNRYDAGGGIGNIWFDNDTTRFRTDYGVSVVHQEDVVTDPSFDPTFASLRLSSDFTRKLTSNSEFINVTIANENLNETTDFRLDMINSLGVQMSSLLALKVSYQILFDNLPSLEQVDLIAPGGNAVGSVVVPVDKFDGIFTVALVLNF